uniref:EamA domain-containing protein n=1 Tax=Octopus bimaculoides TaxID=37653 RepID=A0A0L8HFR3_OCTBM|eukprot:XP_014772656.1 PREDICTED: transmembrane protein 234-like [Octopus bimaculoides]
MSYSDTLISVFWLVLVSVIWGCTNPILKKTSAGIENIKEQNTILQLKSELLFLVFRLKYVTAFLINQCGSILFYLTLASADLSIAVPLTNSLTFVFTVLTGCFLGEKIPRQSQFGMLLIVFGVSLCIFSKV